MGVCDSCAEHMQNVESCTVEPIALVVDGVRRLFEPIRYGSPREGWDDDDPPDRCRDCAVTVGGRHHAGCDMENCPACGEQLIGCAHAEEAMAAHG